MLDETERAELEYLREFKARQDLINGDRDNPNILLIEGRLTYSEGDYSALGVTDRYGYTLYIAEIIANFLDTNSKCTTFQYHVCSEPKGFHELEEYNAQRIMGSIIDTEFYHCYSDLTGYLWTNEKIKVDGHDLYEELRTHVTYPEPMYLAMRIERQ